MKQISLALVGFGNVGQAFARLIQRKEGELAKNFDIQLRITGIATGRHGMAIDPRGLDLNRAIELVQAHQSLDALSKVPQPASILDFIRACPADALIEISPVNHLTGQPAIDHLSVALEEGMHAITANKGPVVHGFRQLTELAERHHRKFMYEATVMDGAPIFSLFRNPLPATDIKGFRGILNSCTNYILGLMDAGSSFEQAVEQAKKIGIAETDPSGDIDGWDAAIKVAALATVLMDVPLKPQDVQREGIRGITAEMLAQARQEGKRWKLVCSAQRTPEGVVARVQPEMIAPGSALYSINGTSSYVQFELDVLPGLGIVENDPGPETTAYGLLADLLNALRSV